MASAVLLLDRPVTVPIRQGGPHGRVVTSEGGTNMVSSTPFSDFLASLSDPAVLERYRLDAVNLIRSHGLTASQEAALLSGNRGAIRMEGVRELEVAGLSPVISD